MVERRDLAGALSRATDWVREEFAYVEDIAAGLGCEPRLESGPGLAFRLAGRAVCRAHPKGAHIGVGLPDRMRPDVEAATGALRAQRGNAWFNYEPGVADRDTVERLFDLSVALTVAGRGPARSSPRDDSSTEPDDDADLELILAVLRAFKDHESTTGAPSSVKPLREVLFFRWEAPRLPLGGKYSPRLPHSPAARAQRHSTRSNRGLIYEHVAPISGVIRVLLRDLPPDERALKRALDASAERVIITRDEDESLTKAGYRVTTPDPDDPWSRYRSVLGLQRSDFAPFTV